MVLISAKFRHISQTEQELDFQFPYSYSSNDNGFAK